MAASPPPLLPLFHFPDFFQWIICNGVIVIKYILLLTFYVILSFMIDTRSRVPNQPTNRGRRSNTCQCLIRSEWVLVGDGKTVWHYLAVFVRPWLQIDLQKLPKYLVTFWRFCKAAHFKWKMLWLFLYRQLWEKLVYFFIPTSGHTVGKTESFLRIRIFR